jgi:predicted Rossmann fold nucleotide-binding protein DprA/Smf involved in DNA uptake
MEREELAGWLRLALTSGIGNGAARRLLAAFGLPASIFTQAPSALDHVATPAQVQALLTEPPELAALAETHGSGCMSPACPHRGGSSSWVTPRIPPPCSKPKTRPSCCT